MRAHGGVGQVDAECFCGICSQLFDGKLVAGERVYPAAQAATTLFGKGEQALGRPLFRRVPLSSMRLSAR